MTSDRIQETNRAGVRDGPAASAAQMGTRLATFSAQFLASCAAKPQVSGLHPLRIADREPSQARLEVAVQQAVRHCGRARV